MSTIRKHTAKVRGDMITLSTASAAPIPFAGEAEVVRTLPTYVVIAQMDIKHLRVGARL